MTTIKNGDDHQHTAINNGVCGGDDDDGDPSREDLLSATMERRVCACVRALRGAVVRGPGSVGGAESREDLLCKRQWNVFMMMMRRTTISAD